MVDQGILKECSYFLVRYVPDAAREEFLNIGVFLHSPEEEFLDCLFTDDFHRIKRFHAQADTALLRELQGHFEREIKEHETDLESYLRQMQDSYSNLIQLTPPRTLFHREPETQIQDLFARYVGTRLAGPPTQNTRMRIKCRLREILRQSGLLDHRLLEKHIPAGQWTSPGDPFTFDYGYRPLAVADKPDGHIKLIHALSLSRDNEIAHVLANTVRYVRQKEPAELTTVVEGSPSPDDEVATHSHRILQDAGIQVRPLSELDVYAQEIRRELLV